jgi:hypothetical protein
MCLRTFEPANDGRDAARLDGRGGCEADGVVGEIIPYPCFIEPPSTPGETRIRVKPAKNAETGMISGDFANCWKWTFPGLEFLGALAANS